MFAASGGRFVRRRSFQVMFPGPVRQVSCAGGTCVAVGPGGVAISEDPGDAHAWRFSASEPLGLLPLSAACAARSACLAVGIYGKAVSTAPVRAPAHPPVSRARRRRQRRP